MCIRDRIYLHLQFQLVSIVGIETNYGKRYAEHSVFNSLYTQTINFPKRSAWATKEIFELLLYSKEEKINPFSLYGSYAGAFGYGQFIPSSFNKLSIDYNKDGIKTVSYTHLTLPTIYSV